MANDDITAHNKRAETLQKMLNNRRETWTHEFHRPLWWWILRPFNPRKALMVFGRHEGAHNGVHRWGTFAITINDCPPPWTTDEYRSILNFVQDMKPDYHDPVISAWKPMMNMGASPGWL